MSLKGTNIDEKYGILGRFLFEKELDGEIGGHIYIVIGGMPAPSSGLHVRRRIFKPSRRHFNGCDTNTENLHRRFDGRTYDVQL